MLMEICNILVHVLLDFHNFNLRQNKAIFSNFGLFYILGFSYDMAYQITWPNPMILIKLNAIYCLAEKIQAKRAKKGYFTCTFGLFLLAIFWRPIVRSFSNLACLWRYVIHQGVFFRPLNATKFHTNFCITVNQYSEFAILTWDSTC